MDTSQARVAILARILANQRRSAQLSATAQLAVADCLAQHPPRSRRAIEGDLKIRFRATAERRESTVDEVAHLAVAPLAAARSGDIEHTMVLGAHWPYRLHITVAAAD